MALGALQAAQRDLSSHHVLRADTDQFNNHDVVRAKPRLHYPRYDIADFASDKCVERVALKACAMNTAIVGCRLASRDCRFGKKKAVKRLSNVWGGAASQIYVRMFLY